MSKRIRELAARYAGQIGRSDAEHDPVLQTTIIEAAMEAAVADERKRADALRAAAYAWWRSKRPFDWSEKQHIGCPDINCVTDAECALAATVAAIRARARSEA